MHLPQMKLKPWRAPLAVVNWGRWLIYNPPTSEDLSRVDVFIALTFGIGPDGTPGSTNEQIAQALARMYESAPKPIIAQKEVREALAMQGKVPMEIVHSIPGPNETQGEYLHHHSSDSVADAMDICRRNGWKRGALAGQAKHMPRVVWCFQRQWLEIIHVETDGIGYCHDSTQKWCRGPVRFTAWELGLAIPVYTLLGKI